MLAYEIMSVAIRMSILTEKKGEIIRRLTVQTLAMPKGAGIAALQRCIFFCNNKPLLRCLLYDDEATNKALHKGDDSLCKHTHNPSTVGIHI